MVSKDVLRRAVAHWPHDALRPTAQLGAVLAGRLHEQTTSKASKALSEQESNAVLSLLTNKFAHKYALPPQGESLSGGIMTPRSNPGYYKALLKDLEEIPDRTWLQKLGIRLRGLIRLS